MRQFFLPISKLIHVCSYILHFRLFRYSNVHMLSKGTHGWNTLHIILTLIPIYKEKVWWLNLLIAEHYQEIYISYPLRILIVTNTASLGQWESALHKNIKSVSSYHVQTSMHALLIINNDKSQATRWMSFPWQQRMKRGSLWLNYNHSDETTKWNTWNTKQEMHYPPCRPQDILLIRCPWGGAQ